MIENDALRNTLQEELEDPEFRRTYGAELAKAELAVAISEARRLCGWTQQDVADRAGVSQAYIAKLESGEANPTIGQLGSIFACLGLRVTVSSMPLTQDAADSRPSAADRARVQA
jgi:transcriptional regulator with XRE-family HTH domain